MIKLLQEMITPSQLRLAHVNPGTVTDFLKVSTSALFAMLHLQLDCLLAYHASKFILLLVVIKSLFCCICFHELCNKLD